MNAYEDYMNELVEAYRRDLTKYNFEELTTTDAVNTFMNDLDSNETTFVVINSMCGCAAGLARPAARTVALQNPNKPDHLVTVFAGQDKEATETMREYIGQAPSSPSMALFEGKELKYFLPREFIEGREVEDIMMDLKDVFDEHCQ